MNIVIDIGTSGYKGSIWTPTYHYSFDRTIDRANGGAQAFYIENGWFYDAFMEMNDKKKNNNRIYDIHDILRILTDSSIATDTLIRSRWSFGCTPTETGDIELAVTYGDVEHKVLLSNLIGDIITYIAKIVNSELHLVLNGVSLLVPWDYQEAQFKLLRNSAEEAQMGRLRLIDERVAAILPYLYFGGIDRQDSMIFLFDYGESVLSFSFIRVWHGHVKIRSSKQLRSFAGRRLNQLILKYISLKYRRTAGSSLFHDVKDVDSLIAECEAAKIQLSLLSSVDLKLTAHGAKIDVSLRRQELEVLLLLPLNAIKEEIRDTLLNIQWTPESIDHVIAIGGNSKIPAVRDMLTRVFPYSEQEYCRHIQNPSTLGGSLLLANQTMNFVCNHLCYRVRCDDGSYVLVGQNTRMLTKEIMLVPIPGLKKNNQVILKLIVECCELKNLTPDIWNPPSDLSCQKGWSFVFGYHYNVDLKQASSYDENVKTSIDNGSSSLSILPVLKQECVQIVSQMVEDGRMVLTMSQVHQGRLFHNSTVRFTFYEGYITEDSIPSNEVVSEHQLLSTRLLKQRPIVASTSSLISSSIIPFLLTDRTRSPILVIEPEKRPHSLLTEPIVITCPNRYLRTHTLPQLINECDKSLLKRTVSETLNTSLNDKGILQMQDFPAFETKPFSSKANQLMFFIGPDTKTSPVTACCYKGEFVNGHRHGQGVEYSISNEIVYQGLWKNDMYCGEGVLWTSDGCRYKGVFVDGKLNGKGYFYRADESVGFIGEYKDGERDGDGTEYEEDGTEYHGEFRHNKRNGHGEVKRGDDVLFEGGWVDGKKEGPGKEISGCTIYSGDFKQGERHGKGLLSRRDGQLIYNGDWLNGKKNGEGCEILKGGIKYVGNFRDDRYEGHGKQWQEDVLVFEGEFVNGLRDGPGTVYNQDGSIITKGVFRKSRLNGECTIYYGSPSVYYSGMVVDDIPNGKGTEHTADGDVYEGEFMNGKWHGHGQLMDSKMHLKYDGAWKYGVKHGFGNCIDDRGQYIGDFVKGLKHGEGELVFYNQDRYIGEFMDDLFNGHGKYISSDGRVIYDGEWRNGMRCGEGKMFLGNGEYFQGMFCNDMMYGKGIYYYQNGMPKYVGEMRNDMRNGEGIEYDTNGEILEQGFYINNECVIPME